ncbi:DeoR/GlpR family DNA-binding transcription regulator [Mycoplasmatota bacterium]|nr:DeoR/GlpR family DNA-binding transcription regulator [Mycoplasmatota bacterium]
MVTNQRQVMIIELLNEKGSVNVEELAKIFNVSKMTVRRDLDSLQEANLLQRTHGGAILNKVLLHEMAYTEKAEENAYVKRCIATRAIEYVKKNMTIFLDAGTTTYEIARRLPKRGIRIITNDLRIASLLMSTDNEIIILGGTVLKETGSVTDHYAQYMLRSLHIDLSFLGTSSVDHHYYLCTPEKDRQAIKQTAHETSKKNILVVDSSKFFSSSLYKILPVNTFDVVISDLSPNNLDFSLLDNIEYVHAKCKENEVEKDDKNTTSM